MRIFLLAVLALLWICSAFFMWNGAFDRSFVTAVTCCISFCLVGVVGTLKPGEEELRRIRNSRRERNKKQIPDGDYIRLRKKMAVWHFAVSGVWGIYTVIMAVRLWGK